jgi:hypothetical protein
MKEINICCSVSKCILRWPLLKKERGKTGIFPSIHESAAGPAMLKPAMTLPAQAIRVDFLNRGFVAADAVGLHHFFPMARERDLFRDPAGIKHKGVFHAVNGLPDVIGADVFMGKMTVDASDAAVRAGMKPGFKLGLHDMAGSAKVRRLGFGHEFRGAEHHEKTPCSSQDDDC